MTNYSIIIPSSCAGMRIDKAISSLLENISRSKVQKALKDGDVSLNGNKISDADYKANENDSIEINLSEQQTTLMTPADIALNIVYEDEDLIVVDKQAGLTVHPGAGNFDDTLANALIHHTNSLSDIGGSTRPGIVHRLDKDTSGLMVVAKNNVMHTKLSKLIEDREVVRKYRALVWGVINPTSGIIKYNIGRSRADRTKMCALKFGGKTAATHYNVEESFAKGTCSLIQCRLQTGRTHQIRVHLSHIGHSVVGDQVYGNNKRKIGQSVVSKKLQDLKRQALHSFYLGFIHPANNKFIEFYSDLPYDITAAIEILKNE